MGCSGHISVPSTPLTGEQGGMLELKFALGDPLSEVNKLIMKVPEMWIDEKKSVTF
jgi:hypothetical protein